MLNSLIVKKAFRIIRRNYGCPGSDHLSIKDIKRDFSYHAKRIIEVYEKDRFGTLPVRKAELLDYNNKPRDIYVYCLYDKWIQQILRLQIEPIVEKHLKDYIFGYRRKLNMLKLREYIRSFNPKFILNLDISKFYDHVDRNYLYNNLLANPEITQEILNKIDLCFSHIPNGLPQGNVLSPMLSNYYLLGVDSMFKSKYARFSDDMFFALDDQGEQNDIINKLSSRLKTLNLSINFEKVILSDAKNF